MNNRLCRIKALVVLFAGVILLSACGTPTFLTKSVDESYHEHFDALELILVRGSFPGAVGFFKSTPYDKQEWYSQVAQRLEQNYRYNGIQLSVRVAGFDTSMEAALASRPTNVPTLLIYPTQVNIKGGGVLSFNIHASLLVPTKTKPVWEAISVILYDEAADAISLKSLNDLSRLKYISLKMPVAETIDGKKNATFGGVLTK